MNVASLELCKELYELSGWRDTYRHYWNAIAQEVSKETMEWGYKNYKQNCSPAYDAGFLLRKLPLSRREEVGTTQRLRHQFYYLDITAGHSMGSWVAGYRAAVTKYPGERKYFGSASAETPENALAKLAIELFKSGVLKRGIGDE